MPDTPQLVERPQDDIAPGYTFGSVTDQIAAVVLTKRTPIFWFLCFGAGFGLLLLFLLAVALLRHVATPTIPSSPPSCFC